MATGIAMWRGVPVETWKRRWGVPGLRVFDQVGSTNDVALELAGNGAPQGTTVLADEQTRGRGRRGRTWTAPAGSSLLMSMVFRPGRPSGPLTLRLGLAVARAAEAVAPVTIGLKWPNDLLLEGRKVGGILCETASEGDEPAFVVAGIGINIRQRTEDWSPELRGRATSLEDATGSVDVGELAGRVARGWLAVGQAPSPRLSDEEIEAYAERDVLRGRVVEVEGERAGRADGIEPTGALRVQTADGLRRIVSGTVRLARTDTRTDP
jgi:BirA family biotin operon repressor/biotin-[acetyl-CoA-carboxylase] ligase